MAESRELKQFALSAPFGKAGKLVIARLDGASNASLNALLKLLEEPPPTIKFILLSEHQPLATIESRSQVVRFGMLSDEEVYLVLTHKMGMAPEAARSASQLGVGSVRKAADAAAGDWAQARAQVLSVVKALSERDSLLLEAAMAGWTDESHRMLIAWAGECLTHRWRIFSPEESFGMPKDLLRVQKLLAGLKSKARPKLALRVTAYPLMERS